MHANKIGHLKEDFPRPMARLRRITILCAMALGMNACSTAMSDFSTANIPMLGGFGKEEQQVETGYEVVLAKQAASLNPNSPVEAMVRDALDLARQKRFAEATSVLAELRESQRRPSEGYQASTATMALLALKAGDFPMFRRLGRQLDRSLGTPVRVDGAYVEVISLYRAAVGRSLPVNAPEGLRRLAAKYFEGAGPKSQKETKT